MTPNEPLKKGKLSKKFFMGLDEGLYLASNSGYSPMQPIFAENVVADKLKEHQWRKIVEVGANGRLCYVFLSKEDYGKYFNGLIVGLMVEGF